MSPSALRSLKCSPKPYPSTVYITQSLVKFGRISALRVVLLLVSAGPQHYSTPQLPGISSAPSCSSSRVSPSPASGKWIQAIPDPSAPAISTGGAQAETSLASLPVLPLFDGAGAILSPSSSAFIFSLTPVLPPTPKGVMEFQFYFYWVAQEYEI
ncbi:hypothetical protein BC826DRAFT_149098 [Russula brevipes]|nr:hypothetical protein BC826DRAFT_149098 [Russula brevipes]